MTDFEVMDQMAKEDKDISFFPDLVEVTKAKGGAYITFGAPEAALYMAMEGKYRFALYCVNMEQFNEIKERCKT